MSEVDEFKKGVIKGLEEFIKKADEIFILRKPKLRYVKPEHIARPIERVIETVRVIRILKNAKNEIEEGGERKWEGNTRW
jgi:lipid II:glycine glycyltransferase (peptidoglycan interpeptide bridge formation enzyme)